MKYSLSCGWFQVFFEDDSKMHLDDSLRFLRIIWLLKFTKITENLQKRFFLDENLWFSFAYKKKITFEYNFDCVYVNGLKWTVSSTSTLCQNASFNGGSAWYRVRGQVFMWLFRFGNRLLGMSQVWWAEFIAGHDRQFRWDPMIMNLMILAKSLQNSSWNNLFCIYSKFMKVKCLKIEIFVFNDENHEFTYMDVI
jgi:hypothetical protein